MPRLSDLQARIHSLGELESVVAALRSVSAARVQQAHGVLDAIRQYTVVLQDALGAALLRVPIPEGETAPPGAGGFVVAFGSEHGFVGGFNERLLTHAAIELRNGAELFVIGSRANLAATERGDRVTWSAPMASQVLGVDEVALRVAEELGRRRDVSRVVLVYTRSSGGATWRIVTETLMPFDLRAYAPRQSNVTPPLSNLEPEALVDGLVEEMLFAQLAHAATESFASENSARLVSMESAADNVSGKLDELHRVEHELRQEEITTELLDVVTGAAAVVNQR
jgi:F-type H+-transporting ATPase subunit gamma